MARWAAGSSAPLLPRLMAPASGPRAERPIRERFSEQYESSIALASTEHDLARDEPARLDLGCPLGRRQFLQHGRQLAMRTAAWAPFLLSVRDHHALRLWGSSQPIFSMRSTAGRAAI